MSFFECERCGGAVGLFCCCAEPDYGKPVDSPTDDLSNAVQGFDQAVKNRDPKALIQWKFEFRSVSEKLYRTSQALARSCGQNQKLASEILDLQRQQATLLSYL